MNNNGAKPLNTNDGWEEIVNENAKRRVSARERVAARRIERKKRTLKASTCLLSVAALVFVVAYQVRVQQKNPYPKIGISYAYY